MAKFSIEWDFDAVKEELYKAIQVEAGLGELYLDNIADAILSEAQRILREGGGGDTRPAFDQGKLVRSGVVVKESEDTRIIGFGEDYADDIEFGRAPGSAPPYTPIYEWAKRQGFNNPKKAAWAIVNKIKRDGTEPNPFFRAAIANIESKLDAIARETVNEYYSI